MGALRRHSLAALALLALEAPPLELHTFSIVAYDPGTGDFGVGVCTFPRGVRKLCPFAKAGVGAVATQAQVNVAFGKKGLKLMEEGMTPQEAVEKCCGDDRSPEVRQLAMVDAKNPPFAFTGKQCLDYAGQIIREHYSVQGNMLVGRETLEAVSATFEETPGSLAGRILAALQAGKDKGGDQRGHNSCAVIVASKRSGEKELLVDLFENGDDKPVESVRKKFLETAAEWMQVGDRPLKKGDAGGDVKELRLALSVKGEAADSFDDAAEAALRAFQRANKLEETGIVDAATARALVRALEKRRASEY